MQAQLLDRKKWFMILELIAEISNCIDCFHTHKRRRSSLEMLTPTECEIN